MDLASEVNPLANSCLYRHKNCIKIKSYNSMSGFDNYAREMHVVV